MGQGLRLDRLGPLLADQKLALGLLPLEGRDLRLELLDLCREVQRPVPLRLHVVGGLLQALLELLHLCLPFLLHLLPEGLDLVIHLLLAHAHPLPVHSELVLRLRFYLRLERLRPLQVPLRGLRAPVGYR